MNKSVVTIIFMAFISVVNAEGGQTALKSHGVEVTLEDFDDYLVARKVTKEHRAQALAKPGAIREIMDRILLIKSLSHRAEANPEVDAATIETLVEDYRMRLYMQAQLDLEVEAALTEVEWDALALDEYKAFPERYSTPETVRASHILVSAKERTAEELDARVLQLMELLDAGESFSELAVEFSDDPGSATKGGDLGYFGRGRMVPEFEAAAFALNIGDLSEPVSTQFGTHIIKITGKKEAGVQSFEKAKPQIIAKLKRTEASRAKETIFERVKADAYASGVEVNEELLREVEASYGVSQDTSLPQAP